MKAVCQLKNSKKSENEAIKFQHSKKITSRTSDMTVFDATKQESQPGKLFHSKSKQVSIFPRIDVSNNFTCSENLSPSQEISFIGINVYVKLKILTLNFHAKSKLSNLLVFQAMFYKTKNKTEMAQKLRK